MPHAYYENPTEGALREGGKASVAVADIATADGSDPATTQALANATKAKVNALLAAMRTAGLLTP